MGPIIILVHLYIFSFHCGVVGGESVHVASDLLVSGSFENFVFANLQIAYEDFPHVGPDHKKTFTCQVVVGEARFEEGSGASKSLAKRNAAMHALKGLFQMNVEMSLKPGSTNKEEIDVSRHPVSILYEYGQKKGHKVMNIVQAGRSY